jgi:hypothetical protein
VYVCPAAMIHAGADAGSMGVGSAGVGFALVGLGLGLREVRLFEEAINAHRDAVQLFLETSDLRWEGIALGNLERYRADQATERCRQEQ